MDFLAIAQRLQALAQAGLFYSADKPFDHERYEEISDLSVQILSNLTDEPIEKIAPLFTAERDGYQTPKVDIRAVIFDEHNRILMVREKIDNGWALPGGWGDVGYTPSEVAVKEVQEETGLDVKAVRLLAVLDKKCHPHPPQAWYVYKMFILCEKTGGAILENTTEISQVAYFGKDEIPPVSIDRNTTSQIAMMFDFLENPEKMVILD
jgi:ADP-ribose pyrophosphatase YjhB (NUDIX family)